MGICTHWGWKMEVGWQALCFVWPQRPGTEGRQAIKFASDQNPMATLTIVLVQMCYALHKGI